MRTELEPTATGIPTFVFSDALQASEPATQDHRVLQVTALWRHSVLSVAHFAAPAKVTLGDDARSSFRLALEALPAEPFTLARAPVDDFALLWTDAMHIEVRSQDEQILDQAELERRNLPRDVTSRPHREYVLQLHDRAAVQVGEVTFVLQYVAPSRRESRSLLAALDFYFAKVLGLSFLAHLFLLLALLVTPADPMFDEANLFKRANRFVQIIKELPPRRVAGLAGGRHRGKEGQVGQRREQKHDALAARGAPSIDSRKKERDRAVVMQSAIFQALNGGPDTAVGRVLGAGLGQGIQEAMGGLQGVRAGEASGGGGMGTRNNGPGGGGKSMGIGFFGDGDGLGPGGRGVALGGDDRGRRAVAGPSRTVTKGCLSQEVVGSVLGRVHSQARYCYERGLGANPNLSGKVTTQFVIGPTGVVTTMRIAASTLDDSAVENCLLGVVGRLRFPPCAGGGTAEVTYPWMFTPAGG